MAVYDSTEYDRVRRAFYVEGRLKAMPLKMKKRLYVLDAFARLFELGRDYPEKEVNDIITPVFGDYCLIRRELVEFGFMERDSKGYRRLQADFWLPET